MTLLIGFFRSLLDGYEERGKLRLAEEFTEQHVKMMDAVFALHGVTSAVIGRGAQPALDGLAKNNVFLLHFIAEGNRSLDAFANLFRIEVMEKPFEDGQRLVG
jgi:hypothetical protein